MNVMSSHLHKESPRGTRGYFESIDLRSLMGYANAVDAKVVHADLIAALNSKPPRTSELGFVFLMYDKDRDCYVFYLEHPWNNFPNEIELRYADEFMSEVDSI